MNISIVNNNILILDQGATRQLLHARHPEPEVDLRNRAIFLLQRVTAMRISEALALRVEQIWDGHDVRACVELEAPQTKGQRVGRTLSLLDRNRQCHAALRHYIRFREKLEGSLDPAGPLFVATASWRGVQDGPRQALDRTAAHRAFQRWAQAANLPLGKNGGITTHTARHTKLSELMNAGKFAIAKAVAGHADSRTLDRYLHVPLSDLHDHNTAVRL